MGKIIYIYYWEKSNLKHHKQPTGCIETTFLQAGHDPWLSSEALMHAHSCPTQTSYSVAFTSWLPIGPAKFPITEVDPESLIITLPLFPFPSARLPPGFGVSPWLLSSFLHRYFPSISHTFYFILVFLLRGQTQTQRLKAKYRFSIKKTIISKYWNLVDYMCVEIFRSTCKCVCNLLLKASEIWCCDE